jgi:hypothetical protein
MDMLSNVKFLLNFAPGIGQKIAILELRINHSPFEDRVHVKGVKCTQQCACETQAAAFGMLTLRAGSPWSRHRLSTTIRALLDGSLLYRGISNAAQEGKYASFLKQLRLLE